MKKNKKIYQLITTQIAIIQEIKRLYCSLLELDKELFGNVLTYYFPNKLLTCRVTRKYAKKTMEFANVMKYVTGSMISQEYTHQVSQAKAPP